MKLFPALPAIHYPEIGLWGSKRGHRESLNTRQSKNKYYCETWGHSFLFMQRIAYYFIAVTLLFAEFKAFLISFKCVLLFLYSFKIVIFYKELCYCCQIMLLAYSTVQCSNAVELFLGRLMRIKLLTCRHVFEWTLKVSCMWRAVEKSTLSCAGSRRRAWCAARCPLSSNCWWRNAHRKAEQEATATAPSTKVSEQRVTLKTWN